MIKTKEEIFIADLGLNPKEDIEGCYGVKIKIVELLKMYGESLSTTKV